MGGEQGSFDILRDIIENVTLVKLRDSVGNFNHLVSIVRCWIFDSNYKRALLSTIYSFNIICFPLEGEVMIDVFEKYFTDTDTPTTQGN